MQQGHERRPSGGQDGHQRGRRDDDRGAAARPRPALARSPRASSAAAAIRARARARRASTTKRRRGDPRTQLAWCCCARVPGATRSPCSCRSIASAPTWPGVQIAPELAEAHVVGAPAECAGAVPRRERRHLVEEEQLGEQPGLQQRPALPAAELQPAGDPAPRAVAPPDAPGVVVHAPAVAVQEAARGIRDELRERRDAVLQRHRPQPTRRSCAGGSGGAGGGALRNSKGVSERASRGLLAQPPCCSTRPRTSEPRRSCSSRTR